MEKTPDFDEIWRRKSDEELFEALAHKGDYVPESIESLAREIARRNLNAQQTTQLEARARRSVEAEATIAQMPLQWRWRILMFLLSFGLPQYILAEYYRNKGYKRRYDEIWKCMIYGLVFWVAIIVISLIT